MKQIFVAFFLLSIISAKSQYYIPLPSCSSMPTNCSIVAVNNGDWDNPLTWDPQRVPTNEDKVCIPAGKTVTVKNMQYTKIVSCPTTTINPNIAIFICGTLNFDASGTLYLGFNSLIQVFDPVGPENGLIKASNGNSDLIKFGCDLKWDGQTDINGPYYISPGDRGPGVLTVAFDYFRAEQKQPYTVRLEWATLIENNSSSFIIERSGDQKTWVEIGTLAARGNSNSRSVYSHLDLQPVNGYNYYRLKQIDNDGQITYSEIIRFNNQIRKNLSVFPNPVGDITQLYCKESFKAGQTIQVIDAKGTRIKMISPTGGNRLQIDLSVYSAGLYLVQLIENGRVVENLQVIKQ